MTSPVDTSVKYFSSTMVNAPVLSGTAGALVALLDAVLKDGFDSKTLTSLVATSGVMTATFTGTHSSLVDTVVLVAGVTGGPTGFAGANGEQKVTARPSSTTAAWATTLPDGTYTGTITMKMAGAGWTKPFSGTNLAAYKSGDVASTGMYLRIDDTGTTSCRVVGYETMSDVNTGTGPFPTALQMSGGGYWTKSQNANGTAVAWFLVTDGRMFYLNVQSAYGVAGTQQMAAGRCFGDVVPYKTGGDAYSCVLNYSSSATPATQYDGSISNSAEAKFATPRDYTGLGSAVLAALQPTMAAVGGSNNSGITTTLGTFPSAVDGGLWLCQKILGLPGANTPRGLVPGLLHVFQSGVWNTFKQGDRAPASGAFAGKTLIAATGCDALTNLNTTSTATNTGIVFFDVTGPWR